MIHIEIDEPYQAAIDALLIEQTALAALHLGDSQEEVDLTILISDNDHLQNLNREFLGIDAPTDVLSFPSDETDPDTGLRYLGDIIISYPRAREQAEAGRHPIEAEIRLLIVHGMLHLLGYDHTEEAEKKRMWAIQAEILTHLGNPIHGPVEE